MRPGFEGAAGLWPGLALALCVSLSPVSGSADTLTRYAYLTRTYDDPPPLSLLETRLDDEGVAGIRLSTRANNQTGAMVGHRFELVEHRAEDDVTFARLLDGLAALPPTFLVADLKRSDLVALADRLAGTQTTILNVRAEDDALRNTECRANVFHVAPSRAMQADGLAQYLVWKKWRRWLLVKGKTEEDELYAAAVRRAASRFGGRIVDERAYRLETGSKRVETGHQQIQTQMPMLTRGAPEHDVIVVADEMHSFGLYLPYRTASPRPVVGTYGLVPSAWHRSYEQYGGMALQGAFETFAGRDMTERDYLAWLAAKLVAHLVMREDVSSRERVVAALRSPELKLAGYKGRPLSFRSWNQQLRQPIILSSARALVSVAPLEGFLHPEHVTDTLGYDAPDSDCRLTPSS